MWQVPSHSVARAPLTPEDVPSSSNGAVPTPAGASPIDVPAAGSAPKAGSVSNSGSRGRMQGPMQGRKGNNMPHGNVPPHMQGLPGGQPRGGPMMVRLRPTRGIVTGNVFNVVTGHTQSSTHEWALNSGLVGGTARGATVALTACSCLERPHWTAPTDCCENVVRRSLIHRQWTL